MDRIFKGQTELKIKLFTNIDLTHVSEATIKFKKPDGISGAWSAEKDIPTMSVYTDILYPTDIDVIGVWRIWAYLVFDDGREAPGETVQVMVVEEGET